MATSKNSRQTSKTKTRKNAAPESSVLPRKGSEKTVAALAEVEGEGTSEDVWTLRLYIAGDSPKSRTALANLQQLCDTHLKGKYKIEVIDLFKEPERAAGDQILAIPTLVRKLPVPMRRIIGTLKDTERVLIGMELTGVM